MQFAELPIRLKRPDAGTQERLINWAYAVSYAATRGHMDGTLPLPRAVPHPKLGN